MNVIAEKWSLCFVFFQFIAAIGNCRTDLAGHSLYLTKVVMSVRELKSNLEIASFHYIPAIRNRRTEVLYF